MSHSDWTRWAALGLFAAATACGNADASERQPSAVGAAKVRVTSVDVAERKFPKLLRLTGSLTASQSSNVASDGTGKVVATFVERGSVVKKGAILARLDASDASLAATEARATAENALTNERQAKLECGRAEKLLASGVISRSEYDQTQARCDAAGHSSTAANSRAQRAARQVGYSLIRAPFAGVVAERFVSVGEYVGPGSRIARIVQVEPLRVEVAVPETATPELRVGQKLGFGLASIPVEQFSATVRFVGPALEAQSRSLMVEAVVDASDARLKPGSFVTTKLFVGERTALAVPVNAIHDDGASPRAWVVVGDAVEERVLSLGEREGGFVAVEKGLSRGERAVVDPSPELRDGVKVE